MVKPVSLVDRVIDLKFAELYVPNCKKSIRLRDMKRARSNAVSLYSEHTHQIFVGGSGAESGMERYDINKDRWDMVANRMPSDELKDIVISNNPNVLILGGHSEFWSFDTRVPNGLFETIHYTMNNFCSLIRIGL